MRDATGAHQLQQTGNWADFSTRMGLTEIRGQAGAGRWTGNADYKNHVFKVADGQGQVHYFVPNPNAKAREGTIIEYFDHGSVGHTAAANIASAPPPLEVMRKTPTGVLNAKDAQA
jgi:hypothetical protein